jgi:hypothetical protein
MKRVLVAVLVALGFVAFAYAADDPSLVQTLSKQLNVSDDQAAGGAGAIFQYAQGALSKDDYGKVEKAVPEASDLIKKAPATDSTTSAVGGALGKTGSQAAGLAGLTSSFDKLGMSSDMVGKFTPIVVNYAEQKGGSVVGSILRGVLTPSAK